MTERATAIAAGLDVGTECVKAVVTDAGGRTLGRAVIPTRGYFQACAHEVLAAALDDAQRREDELTGIGATGFAANCVLHPTLTASEAACHALGAFQHLGHAMTLVNIGGRDPHVIAVDAHGRRTNARGVRRCAAGVGSFLMFTARHLDVTPTRLEELASTAGTRAATVTSYCSVFSATEVLEQLRQGATREEVAAGCIRSIAERVFEIGGLVDPVVVSGGVAEYFPGVLRALESLAGVRVTTVPEPIFTGALGAALMALREPRSANATTSASAGAIS
jgi:predicted CoA-substrate-specific enzyme activase